MATVYIGLGSNIGNKKKNLETALKMLKKKCRILKKSSFYETEPVGFEKQDWFLNAVVKVSTWLKAEKLLAFLQGIERKINYKKKIHLKPREIDLDILFYGNEIINSKNKSRKSKNRKIKLEIPHSQLHKRKFVLLPLAEIAPDFVHPKLKLPIKKLLRKVKDKKIVRKHLPKVLLVCGSPRSGNTELAVKEAAKGAKNYDVDAEIILLRKTKFSGCCGWSDCFYKNYCIVHDKFWDLHKKMLNADAWLLASPNYFNNVTGLMKDFIDRTNPYCRPPLYEGKKVGTIIVGGWSDRSNKRAEKALRNFIFINHQKLVKAVRVMADKRYEIRKRKEELKKCYNLGKLLAREIT